MSELTKKRVRWKEYNGEELIHDEDVDILTSADSVIFSDDETLQYKYTQGQFVNPSTTGVLSNLSTTNKSSLVDAVNEIKTNATTNTSSINSLATRMNTAENDIDSLETRVATTENDIDSLETRVTPITKGGTGATTSSGALSNLGITATASELNVLDGITATTTELNYTDGVTSNIQTQLNGKADSSHNHSASNITSGTLPITRGGTGATTSSEVLTNLGLTATATELNYTDGVTSNIQTQLNGKAPYVVKENTDFNDMKTPGLYTMRNSATNAPTSGSYHSLIVNKSDSGNYVQQLAIKESTWDLYSRYLSSSTWSAWKQYALKEDIPINESGNWTPVFSYWDGDISGYSTSYSYYYRIGTFVHVTCQIKFTSTLTSGKQVSIRGLPYTAGASATGTYVVNNDSGLRGTTRASSITRLAYNENFVTFAGVSSNEISSGDYFVMSITYKVS